MLRNQATKLPKSSSKTSRSSSPTPSERRRSDASPPTSRPSSPAPPVKSGAQEKLASILRNKSSTVTLRGRESKASLREAAAKEISVPIAEAEKNDQADSKSAEGSAQILEEPNVFVEGDEEAKPVELKNLVLVIHGIGQK